jgi:hypothetical protein
MDEIIKWSEGNPGAMNFLMDAFLKPDVNFVTAITIANKIKACPTLRGTNLYVLYSDLCDKDMVKVEFLCKNCPNDILEDACNRQDYSGRKIIEKYFTETEN